MGIGKHLGEPGAQPAVASATISAVARRQISVDLNITTYRLIMNSKAEVPLTTTSVTSAAAMSTPNTAATMN